MQRLIKLTAVISFLLLTGCASQRSSNLEHLALENIHTWTAKGKISVTVDGERKNANFSWLNKGNDFNIRLHGPFGSGAANLKKSGDRVSYTDGKHQHLANSAEALLEEATGWILPISDLRWWIKGLPASTSTILHSEINDNGQLSSLQQQGWHLHFKDYQTVAGHPLPGKILASRNELRLAIVIKEWELKAF